jgi:polyhydroxybutyrate depolymerase
MNDVRILTAGMCVLLLLTGCVTRPAGFQRAQPGSYEVPTAMTYRLRPRTYNVDIPSTYDGSQPVPLVVALHGAFSDGEEARARSGFTMLGEKEGFVSVYPNGIGIFGLLQHWNARYCCGRAQSADIDDVAFVLSVVDDVQQTLNIDPARVFLTGFSNGGMLAQRIAATHPDRFAAVAVLSSSIGMRKPGDPSFQQLEPASGNIPILLLHGTHDRRFPIEGGLPQKSRGDYEFMSFEQAVTYWKVANGCATQKETAWSPNPGVHMRTVKSEAEPRIRVDYGELDRVGHRWPGIYFTSGLPMDHPLKDFDGTAMIWNFFKEVASEVSGSMAIK